MACGTDGSAHDLHEDGAKPAAAAVDEDRVAWLEVGFADDLQGGAGAAAEEGGAFGGHVGWDGHDGVGGEDDVFG